MFAEDAVLDNTLSNDKVREFLVVVADGKNAEAQIV